MLGELCVLCLWVCPSPCAPGGKAGAMAGAGLGAVLRSPPGHPGAWRGSPWRPWRGGRRWGMLPSILYPGPRARLPVPLGKE